MITGTEKWKWNVFVWTRKLLQVASEILSDSSDPDDCWASNVRNQAPRPAVVIYTGCHQSRILTAAIGHQRSVTKRPTSVETDCVNVDHIWWETRAINLSRDRCVNGCAFLCTHEPRCKFVVNGRLSPCRNNFELNHCAEDCDLNCFAIEKTLQPLPEECGVREVVVFKRSAYSRLIKWAETKSSSEHFATRVIATLLGDLLRAFSHGDDLHFPLTFNTPEESLLLYIEKVLAKTEADSSSKCWRWTGTFIRGGYAFCHHKFGKRAFTRPYELAALLSPHSRPVVYSFHLSTNFSFTLLSQIRNFYLHFRFSAYHEIFHSSTCCRSARRSFTSDEKASSRF
ncbi:hypothetical protein M3Y96_00318300 [Aphelenchoides besseyi]|nr:hypothetical protein M3Y96_00318300 [Aphelenchoides besseyi]